ncbi:(Fe-S)-binding protein [Seonamhaeicola aphaedonensis]|uniref:L-lactate dehydrogenase complex protein LldE n=1 Tax=Seonamhaeicola aphaedonensis TaxID=1461338 RepID=A0A3D9HEG9_9FLAO|nr:(Fe-S)-binding protein [Seonamhaeicola aphaedonensis]RED47882.1 L-lactate dehydrogenase complex protein LldE [Seonamhaeicola aphaedonensis]
MQKKKIKVGLFIPCYINQLYPQVGIATLELLEKLDVDVDYPQGQTCCGQPLGNSGYEEDSKGICKLFVKNFKEYDFIVGPSGSCIYHIKHHFDILKQTPEVKRVRNNSYELCEFIVKILGKTDLGASFPHKVGLHKSCHGLRGLKLGSCSEVQEEHYSTEEDLLNQVRGLELMSINRKDECCGFGGTFAVFEEAISSKMGKDRVQDHLNSDVEVLTGADHSCLMHLEGIINRNKQPIKVMHIAEILNCSL